jgi:hypothetical protein
MPAFALRVLAPEAFALWIFVRWAFALPGETRSIRYPKGRAAHCDQSALA